VEVNVRITATVDEAMTSARLADFFPSSWQVTRSQGGSISTVDEDTRRIEWQVGDLSTGDEVTREYTLFSPQRTIPPTKYYFHSQLSYDGGSASSAPWMVIVSDPTTPSVKQAHYRLGNDEPLSAMTWRGGIDQQASNVARNTNFRVRFQVYNDGGGAKSWQPRLDWSATSGSGYAAVPTTSGADPFFVTDTTQFTNGATIFTTYFGCGTGTGTAVDGYAYDTENPPASAISLAAGSYTEIEFNIQANANAAYNTTYYFRLTDAGTALDAYDITEAVVKIQLQPSPSDPHNTYLTTSDKCASCHRSHAGSGVSLRKSPTEEDVCYTCHDGTGASTDISSQFGKPYKHPVAATTWVHQSGENTPSAFSGANRHVECEDCHGSPHSRWPGLHDPGNNAISLVIAAVSGIRVSNSTAWTAPSYTFTDSIAYEYELCFKCHSSWAYGGSPPNTPSGTPNSSDGYDVAAQTDMSVEFNTLNRSHHAVEGTGRNQPPVDANPNWPANGLGLSNNFVSPWTTTSTLQCNDCHARDTSTEPQGTHGSGQRWLLRKNETGVGSVNVLCYNCHRREVYGDIDHDATLNPNPDGALYGDDLSGNDYHLWSRFPHRWYLDANAGHRDPAKQSRWNIWCMTCHGGDTLGGIHGTDRSDVGTGTTEIGRRFLNGATIAGWTAGTTTTNSGELRTKSSTDNVDRCAKHSVGKSWTANYNYAP
jgi:predicted CXXCH cytochrome family protein